MGPEGDARSVLVVGICGSLRSDGATHKALGIALEGAAEMGARTRRLDLASYDLPYCDGRDDESTYPPGVQRFRDDIRAAQGVILATPEYHGSFSGVLKNALDLCGFEEFEGRMVGLVGVSGGRLAAAAALTDLRTIGRVLHAWVVPQQVGVPEAEKQFDERGRLRDAKLDTRVREVGRQVARFAYLHHAEQWRAFLEQWEGATPNPGGEAR